MKLKKIAALILAMVMLTATLAACGNNGNSNSSNSGNGSGNAASADGVVQLNMWVHETDSDEGKLYKALTEEFNAANEGKIELVLTQIPRTGDAGGYDDKVNAAITTGSMPDVFTVDGPAVAANADAGVIVPISEYFDEADLKDFNPSIIQQGTYQNELYTLGFMDSSVLLFYNKAMFEAAGIEPAAADDPWTWDEFYAAAEKLTTDDVYGVTMGLDSVDEWMTFAFLPMIQSGNGNIIADDGTTADGYLNGQAAVDALSFIKKFVDNGVASATPAEKSFEKGQAAMILSGTWQPASMEEFPEIEWGTMPYPVKEKGATAASPCGSWTFAISKDCSAENREAAAEVVKFFTSTDACTRIYGANSMPPARQSAFDLIDDFQSAPLDVVSYQLANTAVARPVVVDYPILSDQFAKAVANVVSGMDVETALNDAVDQYNFQTGN